MGNLARVVVWMFLLPAAAGAERAQVFVDALQEEWGAPGVSAAVAVDGEVVFAGGAGHADAGGTPVDPRTRFRIASVSKAITGVLVLRLAEEGLVELDAPVRRYLPELPDTFNAITVRQVAAHTSGLRHYADGETSHKTEHYESPLEALAPLLEEPLRFEPGTRHGYTTYGYTLLQAVVEAVTDRGFEEALRSFVLEPAGMERTSLDRVGQESSRATGFDRGGPVTSDDVSFKYAGGGMASTPTDLVRLCGAIDRGDLLAPETREALLLRPPFPELDAEQSYGFAIEREITTGLLRIWHPGRGNGFEGYIVCYPEARVAAAVLTNQDWTDPWNEVGRAAETLARLYLPAIYLYRTPPQVLANRLETMMEAGGVAAAVAAYAAYRQEIAGRWDAGLEVHRLAERRTRAGDLRGAGALFEANVEAFPDSWRTHIALAEARLRLGDLEGATRSLQAARPLDPGPDQVAALEEILADLGEAPVASPVGEYSLVAEETGIADELGLTLRVAEAEAGLGATARVDGLGELEALSVLAGGDRVVVALDSPFGLLELDLVRTPAGVEGRWRLGSDSGPLRGVGPRPGAVEQPEGAAPEAAGGETDLTAELAGEVALVGEAALERELR